MSRARSLLLLRVLGTALALGVVVWAVGGTAVRAGAAVLSPGPLLFALGLGACWVGLATARWVLVARAFGARLRCREAYAEYFRSEILNQVVPGGVVGDLDRARRHGSQAGLLLAARSVFVERAAGQVVLVVAAVITVALQPDLLQVARGADRSTVTVVVLLGAAVLAVAVVLWQPWRRGAPRSPRVDAPVAGPLVWVSAGLLSVGVLGCFLLLFVAAARTTGSETPLTTLVPALLLTLLVAGIPLTVAGWGAREAGAALVFTAAGIGAAEGVAASVGYGLLALVAALPGLVPLLLSRRSGGAGPGRRTHDRLRREVEVEADVVTEPERP